VVEAVARPESVKQSARGIVGLIWTELIKFGSLPKADICENPSLLFLAKAVIIHEIYSLLSVL
jgi:hypothetical protein